MKKFLLILLINFSLFYTDGFCQSVISVSGDTVKIDKGKKDGVKIGMEAYVEMERFASNKLVKLKIARIEVKEVYEKTAVRKVVEKTKDVEKGMRVVFKEEIVPEEEVVPKIEVPKKEEKEPTDPVEILSLAEKALKEDNLDLAEKYYKKLDEIVPGNPDTKEGLRKINERREEIRRERERREEEARKEKERKAKIKVVDNLIKLGDIAYSKGDCKKVIEYYKKIVEMDPSYKNRKEKYEKCLKYLMPAIAIAAGGWHTVALKPDGTVVAWGVNDEGQCNVPSDLKNIIAIAAGAWHTVALRQDGTVVAWGGNASDQCNVPQELK